MTRVHKNGKDASYITTQFEDTKDAGLTRVVRDGFPRGSYIFCWVCSTPIKLLVLLPLKSILINNLLVYLSTAKLGALEQRWVAHLSKFNFQILSRPGGTNTNAYALSQCPVGGPTRITDEDRNQDEIPNFTILCPTKKSTLVQVVHSEESSWLGRTLRAWQQCQQADSQVWKGLNWKTTLAYCLWTGTTDSQWKETVVTVGVAVCERWHVDSHDSADYSVGVNLADCNTGLWKWEDS